MEENDDEDENRWAHLIQAERFTQPIRNELQDLLRIKPRLINIDVDKNHQRTALHCLAFSGDDTEMRIITSSSEVVPDVNKKDSTGNSPLHLSLQKKNFRCAEILLGCQDIDINAQNSKGETLLHLILKKKCPKLLDVILDKFRDSIDVNMADIRGDTPLHLAVSCGSVPRLLRMDSILVDQRNLCGFSPLHVAAEWGCVHSMQSLVEAGASVNAKTEEGLSPIHFAIIYLQGNRDCLKAAMGILLGGCMATDLSDQSLMLNMQCSQNVHDMLRKREMTDLLNGWYIKVAKIDVPGTPHPNTYLLLRDLTSLVDHEDAESHQIIVPLLDSANNNISPTTIILDDQIVAISSLEQKKIRTLEGFTPLCDNNQTIYCDDIPATIKQEKIPLQTAMDISHRIMQCFVGTVDNPDPEMEQFGLWKLNEGTHDANESGLFFVKLTTHLANQDIFLMLPYTERPRIQDLCLLQKTDLIRVGGQDGGYATLAEEQHMMCIDLLNKHILCFTDARQLFTEE